MERSVVVKNRTDAPIQMEKLHSGQFHIPYEGLNFSNVHGHWGAEQQRFVQKVSYGKIVIENRRGISTHNPTPVQYHGQTLTPFQCMILPVQ